MLGALKPGEQWMGKEFFSPAIGSTAFNFRRRSNGIVVAFSVEGWGALDELMAKALALPEMQSWRIRCWLTERSELGQFAQGQAHQQTRSSVRATNLPVTLNSLKALPSKPLTLRQSHLIDYIRSIS
jgi:hypothetical protein